MSEYKDLFECADWKKFRALETLGQKAGVSASRLPKLIVKELVDNALDAGGSCRVGLLDDANGFYVEDNGNGIGGDDFQLANLFSINRDMMSSKVLRQPTRGALGNGLRVVVGAVVASKGSLLVSTRGRTLEMVTNYDTGLTVAQQKGCYGGKGTRIEVRLGVGMPVTDATLEWARWAIAMVGESTYSKNTSPFWYDTDAFYNLLKESNGRTVRELIAEFDGCSGLAGKIATKHKSQLACHLSREEAESLLMNARAHAKPVNPKRLGVVGEHAYPGASYAKKLGEVEIASPGCHVPSLLPFVVEAWAEATSDDEPSVVAFVNRTPITADVEAWIESTSKHPRALMVKGCGIGGFIAGARTPMRMRINVQSPYMPITTDGKAPDFGFLVAPIRDALKQACARAKTAAPRAKNGQLRSRKALIVKHLEEAALKASGGGESLYSIRQLYYAVRPYFLEAFGKEPGYNYFCKVITDYEDKHGDIRGMYRDTRGTLYHPHTGQEIPLGTLSVAAYVCPAWTFNKILYCEKEGLFPILRDAAWPERNDCALMSAKGFASRAARDVIDKIAETDEGITFYCIHDADAYGTMIYQTLQGATRARPGRKVRIVNLGLEPIEAIAMGLQVEKVERKNSKAAPVADYVEGEAREWLQGNRVELNAMSSPGFIEWLDGKMLPYRGKIVPPRDVLEVQLRGSVREQERQRITERVLREARVDEQVERAVADLEPDILRAAEDLEQRVRTGLEAEPSNLWTRPVDGVATEIVAGRADESPAGV